jgi:hypothetical protein
MTINCNRDGMEHGCEPQAFGMISGAALIKIFDNQ